MSIAKVVQDLDCHYNRIHLFVDASMIACFTDTTLHTNVSPFCIYLHDIHKIAK